MMRALNIEPGGCLRETVDYLQEKLGPKLEEIRLEDLVVGVFFTGVKLSTGQAGVAFTPIGEMPEAVCCPKTAARMPEAGKMQGKGIQEVLSYGRDKNVLKSAIGVAAVNALSQYLWDTLGPERYEIIPGKDATEDIDFSQVKTTTLVGAFTPYIRQLKALGKNFFILEKSPDTLKGDELKYYRPAETAPEILPQSDIGAIQRAKKAVVIGGGLIGLEVAKALKQRGLEVTVVEIAPHLLLQQLDPLAARLVQQKLEQAGVSLRLKGIVREINGTFFSKKVKAVHLDHGERIECPLVVIATGVNPNLDLTWGANILVNRGIWVNDYLETSLGDRVYAAGDMAEPMNLLTGSTSLSSFWPNAVHQGRVAAMNMAGKKVRYPGTLAMQGSAEFYHLPLASYGLPPSDCNNLETVTSYLPAQGIYQKLSLDQGVPKGMILVGDIRKAGIISALIRKMVDISGIKHRIWEPNFSYAHLLKEMVPDFRNYLREAA